MIYVLNALFLCMITIFLAIFFNHQKTWKIVLSYGMTLFLTSMIYTPFFSWLHILAYFVILECHVLIIIGKQPMKRLPLFLIPLLYGWFMFIFSFVLDRIDVKERLLLSLIVLCVVNIVVLVVFAIYLRRMKEAKEVFLNMVIYFPIFFLFELYCMHQRRSINHDGTVFLSVLGILLANFMVLYILYKISTFQNKESELVLSKNREDALLMKYESMKEHYESQFAFVHQLLHQCTTLQEDMKKQDYKHLETIINQISEDVFTQFNTLYSNSAILNYAISEHMDEIKQYDIYMKTVMEYNDFSFLPFAMQTALFTSLLELALDGVKTVSCNRMIVWKTKQVEDACLLQVSFTRKEKVDEEALHQQMEAILLNVPFNLTISYDEAVRMVKVFLVFQDVSCA